ncbi:MAG: DUF3782 domain-containing protein [Candidatus Bathyarchaeia archaeon]
MELLERDRVFRRTVAGLIGYRDIMERFEEHDKKFNDILAELREHKKILEEHSKRFEEHDKKFNDILAELREHRKILEDHSKRLEEHSKRFEEHDKKFNEIIGEIHALRKDFELLGDRVEVTIGRMGRRWGIDLERTVLRIFKEALEARGIEPGKVEKFRFKDVDGKVTGIRGKIIDVDVLIRDDKLYVVEVKSMAEIEHVESLPEKAGHLEKILGRPVEKTLLVAVHIDREAYERARELNIEVIYSHIIE